MSDLNKEPYNTENNPLDVIIRRFVDHLDSLHKTTDTLMAVLSLLGEGHDKDLLEIEKAYCQKDDSTKTILVKSEKYAEYKKKLRDVNNYRVANILLPRALVTSLVSQYDAYIGKLLRSSVKRKDSLLNNIEGPYQISEILGFESIESFKQSVIDKEIESILHEGPIKRLPKITKILNYELSQKFEAWKNFVEVVMRRHLFVHTDGMVSSRYIETCNNHGVDTNNCELGKHLSVSAEYFELAHNSVYEVGFRHGHLIWRHLFPDEIAIADRNFNDVLFELIQSEQYTLACSLFKFAEDNLDKQSKEETRLIRAINHAQAHKWQENEKECQNILDRFSWNTRSTDFRLAAHVLKDEWKLASSMLLKLDNDCMTSKYSFANWPLFKKFREQPEFLDAFEKKYNEKFTSLKLPPEESKATPSVEDTQ